MANGALPLDAINGLGRLEQGTALEKLYEAICLTSDAVLLSRSTNPSNKVHKGKVSFEVEIIHDREWETNQVVTRVSITTKTPKHEPRGATFFVYEGSLFRENPLSEPLPNFRAVPDSAPSARTIDPPGAAAAQEG